VVEPESAGPELVIAPAPHCDQAIRPVDFNVAD
jgi:hypothetical protein